MYTNWTGRAVDFRLQSILLFFYIVRETFHMVLIVFIEATEPYICEFYKGCPQYIIYSVTTTLDAQLSTMSETRDVE